MSSYIDAEKRGYLNAEERAYVQNKCRHLNQIGLFDDYEKFIVDQVFGRLIYEFSRYGKVSNDAMDEFSRVCMKFGVFPEMVIKHYQRITG